MASFLNVRPSLKRPDVSRRFCMVRVLLAIAALAIAAVRIVSALSELATPGAAAAMCSLDQRRVPA